MKDLFTLPENLPVPQDDGACNHLHNIKMPSINLTTTKNREVNLNELAQNPTVIFFYPRTGTLTDPTADGWDLIPGARGCTPQSCGFRDLYSEFKEQGFNVFGASTQSTEYQQEFVKRNHIPFEILSDEKFLLTEKLKLPTFEFNNQRLIKRMAMVLNHGNIVKVFYPVFPPDKNAEVVLEWIKQAE
ncbi:MAG: peroxiredoxin [Rhizobacter sp.]|nr:peroxiredoxin [Bacteriovorax sp.]